MEREVLYTVVRRRTGAPNPSKGTLKQDGGQRWPVCTAALQWYHTVF